MGCWRCGRCRRVGGGEFVEGRFMELIILRDIAAANEQAWAEQRLLYEQLIADFEPPA